ncbi:MAG TPA: glycosyltransferase family 39 protein [Patescibacteria group bacterium]|nr:glycosyltransferase family 39 protein [Patescibacteria group bacterium]
MIKKLFSFHISLFLLLLLAAFLRLYHIRDYLTFLGDEGRDVLIAYNILHGHLTLLGPTASVGGFFLGPIYYYFIAPFLWLFQYDPVGPAVMVALFGVATVWLVYFVGERFFNKTTGFIAATLYTISPLVIAYARSSWNPNLMPFFTLLLLFVAYKAVKKDSWRLFACVGILYGIVMQLHYIEVFIGVVIAVYIFIAFSYQKKHILQGIVFTVKNYVVFLIGFLIGWSPFLAFEARHGFPNTRSILQFVFMSKEAGAGAGFSLNFLDVFYRLFGRLVLNIPSPDLYKTITPTLAIWMVAVWVVGIVATGNLLFLLWKHRNSSDKFLQYSLLVLWLFFGVILFGFYRKAIYDYYLEFIFPLPFFLVGEVGSFLLRKNLVVKGIATVLLLVLVAINLTGVPFRYPANKQLQQTEIIAQNVLQMTHSQPYNFALITGGNSDYAYRYFLTIWGHPPVTIENPSVDPQRKTVTKQLIVVCESVPCGPLGYSLWEIAGFGRADIAEKKHVVVVDIYRLVHYQGK